MLVAVLLFALGLLLLIKGGDWFVDGATGVAAKLRVPEIIIGATVVSIGTTLPEVMVSATSALQGIGEMSYGNAIGSVICNTALIAALTVAIRPSDVDKKSFLFPVCFFFGAAALYLAASYFLGEFNRLFGILLLAVFVVYMTFTLIRGFRHPDEPTPEEEKDTTDENEKEKSGLGKLLAPVSDFFDRHVWFRDIAALVVGAALIAFGADLLVDNGTLIAEGLGVPTSVIALTFVALGTSLPELVTAATSLVKGHSSLSLGNIVGANLFNLVLVSGLSVTLAPFDLPQSKVLFGQNATLVLDLPLMVAVMAILTVPALISGKVRRWQGVTLLCVYTAFVTAQFFF